MIFPITSLVFCLLISLSGYSRNWTEDWESPDWQATWTITNSTREVGTPTSGPNAAHGITL